MKNTSFNSIKFKADFLQRRASEVYNALQCIV